MYQSRIEELAELSAYRPVDAAVDYYACLQKAGTDNLLELTYNERKRIHHLKYYTWVEQQGRSSQELDDLWYAQDKTFEAVQNLTDDVNALIDDFNDKVGIGFRD
jgi:hypothetical protein